jgi:hypothetical protein
MSGIARLVLLDSDSLTAVDVIAVARGPLGQDGGVHEEETLQRTNRYKK